MTFVAPFLLGFVLALPFVLPFFLIQQVRKVAGAAAGEISGA